MRGMQRMGVGVRRIILAGDTNLVPFDFFLKVSGFLDVETPLVSRPFQIKNIWAVERGHLGASRCLEKETNQEAPRGRKRSSSWRILLLQSETKFNHSKLVLFVINKLML